MTKEEIETLEKLLRLQEYKLRIWKNALDQNIKGDLSDEDLAKARKDYYRVADDFAKMYIEFIKKDVKHVTKY